jgi:3-oxosteroid 1-dehydrogenase
MHRDIDPLPDLPRSTYDAVLVGATAGSLFAAIKLARAGLRPLVLEKSGLVGGGTAYSGGIVWAPNNHRMQAKGVPDSTNEGLQYLDQIAGGRGDADQARIYVEVVGRALLEIESFTTLTWVTYRGLPDYWAERTGGKPAGRFLLPLSWKPTTLGAHQDDVRLLLSRARHEHDWAWGRALVGALYEAALALDIPVRLHHRVVGLLASSRGVHGVRVLDDHENEREIHASKGVLLNTGGFEWNGDWTAHSIAGPRPHPQTPPVNEGDGHAMLADLGVPLALMDRTIAIPGVRVSDVMNDGRPLWRVFFQPLARPHSLVVNGIGRRFGNESFFVDLAAAMQAVGSDGSTPNTPAYFIWDAEYQRRYGTPGDIPEDLVVEAASLAKLAACCSIPADPLRQEVETFNAIARSGEVDPFGRGMTAYARNFGDPECRPNPTMGTVEAPPFRAVSIELTTAGHRGGAVIDDNGRVLGTDGNRVEGLYACGNVAAGTVTGQEYFSGASIGHTLVSAALAAEDMISHS